MLHDTPHALFIGRFQPFHLGHLDAITQILEKHDRIIIAIGSAQYKNTFDNPFSAALRRKMIERSLAGAGIHHMQFSIVEISDINNDEQWISHVAKLCPTFEAVYSGTPKVQKLFKKYVKKHGGYRVFTPRFNLKISGTLIRKKMRMEERTSAEWEKLVPPAVARLLKK